MCFLNYIEQERIMNMNIKIARLKKDIAQYNRLVIYGAGDLAKKTNNELIERGIFAEYCVVSSKNENTNRFENMPLYSFSERIKDMQKSGVITLIAVTELYEKEIEQMLIQNGVKKYLFITEYLRKTISFEEYKNKTEQEYLIDIAEWCVDAHNVSLHDIGFFHKKLEYIIEKGNVFENKIVFAVGNLSPRVIKIADALQKKGYKIEILFYPNVWRNENFCENLVKKSDEHCFCETIEELMYRIITSYAKIVHLFSYIGVSYIARILIRQKKLFPKLVFEQYDIANEMYIEACYTQNDFEDERYCLEHADGLCCRGYEQEYLMKVMQYIVRGKVIKFFDYCQNFAFGKRAKSMEKPLSLCYVGGIATERECADASYACFLEFAEMCEKNKCHFHVYPSSWDEYRFADYIELDSRSEYFHLHKPVSYEKLCMEISQYDYGVHPIRRDFNEKDINGHYTKNKLIYTATNHFFDYLDAGLPIISAVPVKFIKYFEEEGVLLRWTMEEYNFEELMRRRDELRDNVVVAQRKMCINKKIDDLIEFYNLL